MCVVSMIYDHYRDEWGRRLTPAPYAPHVPDTGGGGLAELLRKQLPPKEPAITPEEIAEFRRLLERAREYDKRNNEPECELESKRQQLRDLAQQLGVEIAFL